MAAAKTSTSSSLKEYLKRYESQAEEEKKKNKKKKKKNKSKTRPEPASAVRVVDEDPVWHKPIAEENEEDDDDSADEEKPQVEEDIDVKRMKRLEQLRLRRPYNAISEDGSGWISVSDAPKQNANGSGGDSDMSPPRKRHQQQPSVSGRREEEDNDLSPPQRRKRYHTPSPEPIERKASGSIGLDSDMSPPRNPRTMGDKKRTNSEIPDMLERSPPRGGRRSSPDLDLSPPRQRRKRYHTPSVEPETKPYDNLPPRGGRQDSPYPDDQKASRGIDLSPPRRGQKDFGRHESLDDASRASLVSDLSPPRKSRKELSSLKERPKTGLITGQDIKEVNAKTKKDDWLRFKEMDPAISGRGAEPVYRDKLKGERISKDEFAKSQRKEEKPKEKKLEWGKGLAQKREAEERELELELEKDKPFARTRDDPELDKMLKERVRWGDPMAHLVKKSHPEALLRNLGDSDKMTESGFIIPQDIPNHSWIKRGLEAAPNRYGIKPGRHWDGVDRSNGFEKGIFKRTNEKQATQREAYLWSVADM